MPYSIALFRSKVVSETHNVKTSNNQGITSSGKANQSELKDTNFEYEDNEWDIGKPIQFLFNPPIKY